jgi:cell division protein FtsB
VIQKIILTFAIIAFIGQIVFSFLYSSEMITQNQLLSDNQKQIKLLEENNNILENNYFNLTSPQIIDEFTKSNNYQYIKTHFK